MIFKGSWTSLEDIQRDFDMTPIEFVKYKVLLAVYEEWGYEGNAFVLLQERTTGKLFEINASHCSCYGLEGQWEPEETSVKALTYRMAYGALGEMRNSECDFRKELRNILHILDDTCTQYATSEEGYVTVKKKSQVYFVSHSALDDLILIPDHPDLFDSECDIIEREYLRKWVLAEQDSKIDDDGLLHTETYIKNPEIDAWSITGKDHKYATNQIKHAPHKNDSIYVERKITRICRRLKTDDLYSWLIHNNAFMESGEKYNIDEEYIVVLE